MRIVVVSPFAAERTALCQLMADDGHEVCAVTTRDEGLALVSPTTPCSLIADAQLAGPDNLVFVRALRERGLVPHVVLLSPRATPDVAEAGVRSLLKPIDLGELRVALGLAGTADRRSPQRPTDLSHP